MKTLETTLSAEYVNLGGGYLLTSKAEAKAVNEAINQQTDLFTILNEFPALENRLLQHLLVKSTAYLRTLSIGQRVKDVVKGIAPQNEIILFGSRARGDFQEYSDWDILILSQSGETPGNVKDAFFDGIYELMIEEDISINYVIFPMDKWEAGETPSSLIDNVRREGVRL